MEMKGLTKFFPKKHSKQKTQHVKHECTIMKAADIEGVVLITIPFTPEEAKTVTGYLNRSSVV